MREFLRLVRYVLPWWKKGIAALVCASLFALFSGATVGMILPFTKILFEGKLVPAEEIAPAGDAAEGSLAPLENWKAKGREAFLRLFADEDPEHSLFKICVAIFLVFLLKGVFHYLHQILMVTLQERTIKSLRDDLYRSTARLPMAFFEKSRTGELISRITNDVTLVKDMVSVLLTQVIQNILLLLVYVIVAAVVSWRLALLSFIIFPILGIFTGKVSRRLRKYSTRFQEDMARITSSLQETITGIRIVKAFATEEYEEKRFRRHTGRYLRSFLRFRSFAVLASPVAEQLGVIGSVIVLWYGGRQVIAGAGLGPEGFFLFLAAVLNMMQPIRKLSHTNTVVQQGLSAATRIFLLLDTPPEPRPEKGRRAEAVRESILYDRVSFRYDGADGPPALTEITLEIPSGAMVALVGPSGAGKSTLADLLPRFHDPTEGRVLLDGVDLREFDLSSLRGIMGIVTQETILFNETIADNIAYGRADISREKITDAARAANAAGFIERFPEGYETVVGDRGLRLSGGERQRLAIARAILQNPPVLILDEATSSLDAESEALVQDAVEKLVRDRTTLVIAHRLSTILRADRIAVLDRGRLIQAGTHAELLREGGVYRKLFEMQFQSEGEGRG